MFFFFPHYSSFASRIFLLQILNISLYTHAMYILVLCVSARSQACQTFKNRSTHLLEDSVTTTNSEVLGVFRVKVHLHYNVLVLGVVIRPNQSACFIDCLRRRSYHRLYRLTSGTLTPKTITP